MELITTRLSDLRVDAPGAILRGLAPDGGLFVPDKIPAFSRSEIESMAALPYPELATEILFRFLPGFTREELLEYARKAYASFDDSAVTPLHALEDGLWTMELFHGPTCAFKDVALQLLPYLLSAALRKCGEDRTVAILVATSGDTGKAALQGFADVPGTRIGVFYPRGGVSDIQRAQMVTQEGDNVLVLSVEGNFDDAQSGVKKIFSDIALKERLEKAGVVFSSANSINWGRLVPQIVYYYAAYFQLLRSGAVSMGDPVDFSVPTGNFGDILAGYLAKRSGLPVGRLICASNSNNVLTEFLQTGVYNRNRPFLLTMSPSMDILLSSNLERLLYFLTGSGEQVSRWMTELGETGCYDIGPETLARLKGEGFAACWSDEALTGATIRGTWEKTGYLVDPHTAVALYAARQVRKTGGSAPCVVLSTASPFKFAPAMLASLGQQEAENGFAAQERLAAFSGQRVPAPLDLRGKRERFLDCVTPAGMASAVEKWLTE